MSRSAFAVRAGSGSLRGAQGIVLSHEWTGDGVVAGPAANGAQLLHLSVALCILNDHHREAARLGLRLDGVAVDVDGGFDEEWRSTGVEYTVVLDSPEAAADLEHLTDVVDALAEVPRAIRAGVPVARRT